MLSVVVQRFTPIRTRTLRCFATKPWDLFPAKEPVKPQAPQYMMNMKDNLEFALERMRLTEGPVALQLLNRNARRPKKTNHRKRPCSHHRRRLNRLGKK